MLGRAESVTLWSGGGAKKQRVWKETQRARVLLSFRAGRSHTMNFTRTGAIADVEQGLQGSLPFIILTVKINKQNNRPHVERVFF